MDLPSVLIVGHSYVNKIENLNSYWGFKDKYNLSFFGISGAKVSDFNNNLSLDNKIRSIKPQIIVLVVGGNDISNYWDWPSIKENYGNLVERLNFISPYSHILLTQIEERYLTNTNRFGTPTIGNYKKYRSTFNQFIRRLSNKKHYLHLVVLAGHFPEELYSGDKVHLNNNGFKKFLECILVRAQYCLEGCSQI